LVPSRAYFKLEQLNEKQPGNTRKSQSAEAGIKKGIVVYLAATAPDPSRAHEIEF
jgi:hypothetical protein